MAAAASTTRWAAASPVFSTDAEWLVPHFEKMLYDNALLAPLYFDAACVTANPYYERVGRRVLDYVIRDMTDETGGYHSAEDADSEGVEGKFYVWTPAEIADALGQADAELFCAFYDVTDRGNFEGKNILNIRASPRRIRQSPRRRPRRPPGPPRRRRRKTRSPPPHARRPRPR
jgi:uncharacterized protein